MTSQFRLTSGSNIFDFASNGWYVPVEFVPPAARYTPLIASGVPSPDYPGGELVAEFVGDVTFTLPLFYKGNAPEAARRMLESFVRRGVNGRNLQLQKRQDRAFTATPLWGQWGAWQAYEIIHAGSLVLDGRAWEGYDGVFAQLPIIAKPALIGQAQQAARAYGTITHDTEADGMVRGVTVEDDDASALIIPPAALVAAAGTCIIAWEAGPALLTVGNPPIFFINSELTIYWNKTTEEWAITDGTNSDESSGESFPTNGTLCIFHATWATGALKLYKNGVLIASTTYTAFTPGDIYIGTDDRPENGIRGVFRLVATYATAMSAAQVATDAADVVKALAGGPSPSPIPYLWTPNGDNIFDNCRDDASSTDAPHYNYGWIANLPGSLPAAMDLRLEPSVTGNTIKRLAVSLADYDSQFDPLTDGLLYNDRSGASNNDSSGGAYLSTTIDTTFGVQIDTDQTDAIHRALAGRQVAIYARIQSGATGAFQIKPVIIAGDTITGAAKNVATAAAFRLVRTQFLTVPPLRAAAVADAAICSIQLYAGRSAGSGTALIDYGMVMARPLAEINTTGLGAVGISLYEGQANRYGLTETLWASLPYAGDVLRPHPHRQNLLMLAMGNETVDPLIAWNAEATVTITPRWSVI
jgi:hypothetical protein